MRFLLLILLLALPLQSVGAQNIPVYQSGGATTGHLAMFGTNGVIADAGKSPGGPPGVNPNNLNITGPNDPFCLNDAPITSTGGYHQICLGFGATPSNQFEFVLNSIAGASQLPCVFIVNGTTLPCIGTPTGANTVANTTALRLKSISGFTGVVIRVAPYPATSYAPAAAGACTADDGGACVAAVGGGFWQAQVSGQPSILLWGASTAAGDNSAAIQAAVNWAVVHGARIYAPGGTYNFATPITAGAANGWGIIGDQQQATVFNYTGASTTPDIFAFGDQTRTTYSQGVQFSNFTIDSSTTMTAGDAFHAYAFRDASLDHVHFHTTDGGTKNLWNGYDDDDGNATTAYDMRTYAQNDCIRAWSPVGAAHPENGLTILGSQPILGCNIGVHMGGGAGGVVIGSGTDILLNNTNVAVDNSLSAADNNQLVLDASAFVDTSLTGPNVLINSSFGAGAQLLMLGWNGSAHTNGIEIQSCAGDIPCEVHVQGRVINPKVDGVVIDSGATNVGLLLVGAPIYFYGAGGAGGYGIHCLANANTEHFTWLGTYGIKSGSNADIDTHCAGNSAETSAINNSGLVRGGLRNSSTNSAATVESVLETGLSNVFENRVISNAGSPSYVETIGSGITGNSSLNVQGGPYLLQMNGHTSYQVTQTNPPLMVIQGNWGWSGNRTPLSSSDTCTLGMLEADVNFLYYCKATNTWVRASWSTF